MNDLKFAFRQLLKNPGFAMVAVLTLGLGIGACAAMFSLINAVLLRPLPFRDVQSLVWIENIYPGDLSGRTIRMDNFIDWQAEQQSFEELAAYCAFFDQNRFVLTGTGDPQRLRGVPVSKNFLPLLGVQPMLGRNFADEECLLNGRKAVILSHAFWQRQFAGDTKIIGRSINLGGSATEIVGVLPPWFDFDSIFNPGTKVELLVPLPIAPELANQGNILFAIGRLKPKVTIERARVEFDVMNKRLAKAHPERWDFGSSMSDLVTSIRGAYRQPMVVLCAAVACVLLIACFNLSNLLLARANARRKELAVRVALGATRWHLIRQTLIESLLLALGGCALGVPLAFLAADALARLQTFNIPLMQFTSVDATVLGFTVGIAVLAGLISGTLPAIHLPSVNTQERLNADSSRGGSGATHALVRKGLVTSEIAMACVLLVAAGLLIESFSKLLDVNLGFQPKQAVAWRLSSNRTFKKLEEANQYFDQLVSQVAALPGVESAGLTDALPLGRNRSWGVGAKGVTYRNGEYPGCSPRVIDDHYLQTMQIPLLEGRYFDTTDTAKSEKIIVINETMARVLWPGQKAIGQVAEVNGDSRVIGVVANVRHAKLEEAGTGEIYLNYKQCGDWPSLNLVVRSARPVPSLAADVRTVMKRFDGTLPSTEFIPLAGIVDQAVAPRRLITHLLGAFSFLALVLAVVGLYGVVAYSVTQRTREIGIRMAVGAQRADVMSLILGEGFKMAAVGVAIGLVAALVLMRVLSSLLFGVSAADPFTFLSIALLLVIVALAACAIPARRAAKVQPMEALRYE
ncbi:MAG TPA: ABC transporter permease [Candidatus Limnocylindrales bacterium]|nr:ABC transporter permease [Candidatus Limnocylindrales bacterium]